MAKLNILVPTDFSKNANNALYYAVELARKFNASITLLNAYTVPILPLGMPASINENEVESVRKDAEVELKNLKSLVNKINPNLEVKTTVEEGQAANEIDKLVKKGMVDFIVMGSKGATGLDAIMFGSVAEEVVENVSCPVFVIPETARFREIKQVVYASDLIEGDQQKLAKLSSFAKAFNAVITILNVSDDNKEIEEALLKKFEKEVKEEVDYPELKFEFIFGTDVVKALEKYVEKNKPDIMAMSTRKRAFYESFFNPSISKTMISHTHIPLLIFHF